MLPPRLGRGSAHQPVPLVGLATVAMLGASLLPLLFAYIGWRRDRARTQVPGRDDPRSASFDELLARFERLQHELRRG